MFKHIRIIFNGKLIADTHRAKRILETSHPPNYYISFADIEMMYLTPSSHSTYCEWKGQASYYTVQIGHRQAKNAAWYYPNISPEYEELSQYVGFYPRPMDACYVDDEKVKPQAGNFYAGWITSDIVGPFKGDAGTWGW
ncbi:conserved domain protein [Synechococcus sp. PCC 7335]|nr:conserved domain protein [Synechococcus sp. PCC 7335]